MGGCRCVYRSCQNSTAVSPGLHYFHFPVRDPPRCELWIQNAQKPAFRDLEKDKLRNKVVCSIHFENKCFTNEKHDRLIHSAVPTLGFEDDVEQPMQPDPIIGSNFHMGDDNIMLIPIDEDNTKFAIPNVEFAGMSYTIFDDAVIPTSKIEEVIINELKNNPSSKPKDQQIRSVVKQIKTNLPSLKRAPHAAKNTNKHQDISQFTVFQKDNNQQIRTEVKIVNTTVERSNNNIPSYSVSTLNGDVSVEPSTATHILPDIITDNEQQIPDFPMDPTVQSNINQNHQSIDNFSLDLKSDNEFTMSVTPVGLIQNLCNNDSQEPPESKHFIEQPIEEQTTVQTIIENDENNLQPEINENQPEENIKKEYVDQIKTNTKQIKQLKNLVRKQSRFNRMLWQKRQMPHFKKKIDRSGIIKMLKDYVKPSLLAMLKLELLPVEEVVLDDQEEKFINDLYTEYPECYDLLRTKFNWNLPFSEKSEDSENMQCE